jgi:hypothetical protein
MADVPGFNIRLAGELARREQDGARGEQARRLNATP